MNFRTAATALQAVLVAFCEDYGMEKETALAVAAGFGSGMGGLRETCGTVTGANMVIGLAKGEDRMAANKTFRAFAERFKEKNGSLVCRTRAAGCPRQDPPDLRGSLQGRGRSAGGNAEIKRLPHFCAATDCKE